MTAIETFKNYGDAMPGIYWNTFTLIANAGWSNNWNMTNVFYLQLPNLSSIKKKFTFNLTALFCLYPVSFVENIHEYRSIICWFIINLIFRMLLVGTCFFSWFPRFDFPNFFTLLFIWLSSCSTIFLNYVFRSLSLPFALLCGPHLDITLPHYAPVVFVLRFMGPH